MLHEKSGPVKYVQTCYPAVVLDLKAAIGGGCLSKVRAVSHSAALELRVFIKPRRASDGEN